MISFLWAIWSGVWTALKWIGEGIQTSITHPVVLTIEVICLVVGVWLGVCWDAHDVDAANTRAATADARAASLADQVKGTDDVDKRTADAAIAAREAAKKELPLLEPDKPVAASVPPSPAAAPTAPAAAKPAAGVRNGKSTSQVRRRPRETSLLGF